MLSPLPWFAYKMGMEAVAMKRRGKGKGRYIVFNREYFAEQRRKAWKKLSDEERKQAASKASRAYWDSLTKEQRSAEMKRRAAKRKKKSTRQRRR